MTSVKKLLGLGATISALLGTQAAFALPPGDWSADPAQVLNVYFGGATATDNALENTFLAINGGICAAGTIDIYRVPTTNRNNRVIFCRVTANQVAGFPASNIQGGVEIGGRRVAFHKESIGGSSNGVVPMAREPELTLDFFNMANAAGCGAGVAVPATAVLKAHVNRATCADTTVPRITNGGISDTEPHLSSPALSLTEIGRLQSTRGLGIVFGVPVNLNLYRALQRAQGFPVGDGTVCDPDPAPTAFNSDAQACVPSLTRSQVRGLYSGKLLDWSSITAPNGNALWTFAGSVTPTNDDDGNNNNTIDAADPADTSVFVCRRVDSSGTQASFESYWLQQRCNVVANRGATLPPSFVTPDDGSSAVVGAPMNAGWQTRGGGFVNGSESSGDVRNCIAAHQANGTWAIGTLSTEVSSGNLTQMQGRMVRVDGALPNLASVANGDYDFFTENTLNRRRAGLSGAPTGETLTLLQALESRIGTPSLIAAVNSSFRDRPWGDGGVLSIANGTTILPNAAPADQAVMRTNPVNSQTRSAVNNTVNNCSPPIMNAASPAP